MSVQRSFKEDKVIGDKGEDTQLEPISKHLNITLNKSKNNARFDFQSACDNVYVELKTRTCKYNDYDTTIIPHSKIKFADENPQRTYYFCFLFTDGLYQIEYNKKLFDTFEVKDYRRRQRIDFNDKVQKYCFIPVKHLKLISDPRLENEV